LLLAPLTGNSSATVSGRDPLKAHSGQWQTAVGLEYLGADSALYTAATLPQRQACCWCSRVPATLSVARAVMHTVAPVWRQPPDTPAQCSLGVTSAGVKQRWRSVWSPPAYQRALGPVTTPSLKPSQATLQAFNQLCRQDFTGATAARNALVALAKTVTRTTVVDRQLVAVPQ
jgi:hypothetical protein